MHYGLSGVWVKTSSTVTHLTPRLSCHALEQKINLWSFGGYQPQNCWPAKKKSFSLPCVTFSPDRTLAVIFAFFLDSPFGKKVACLQWKDQRSRVPSGFLSRSIAPWAWTWALLGFARENSPPWHVFYANLRSTKARIYGPTPCQRP